MLFFPFGNLIWVAALLLNSIAILSEDRFLARIGMSATSQDPGFGTAQGSDIGVKNRMVMLINSVRTLMRIPLIGINIAMIVWELIAG